ncbi:hypothetical protein [Actinospica robiniae]|uniref:hypothetical protein n=1 Tax=Actinospica robiniae TaxID=304901 RepID=UPI0003FC8604|nr:hypothetical protein [Actinospica robiniae]
MSDLTELLNAFTRAAGWHPAPPRAEPAPLLANGALFVGAWAAPHEAAHLAAGELEVELEGYELRERYATIALTATPDAALPWAVTGQCPLPILPQLLSAAVLPPDTPAADPISVLPRLDYRRETCTGFPRGRYHSESYYQWEIPTPPYRLAELHWCVPGATRADLHAGWDLHLYGAPYTLHADLATSRHLVTALITALTVTSPET